jgi:hypothetical protein
MYDHNAYLRQREHRLDYAREQYATVPEYRARALEHSRAAHQKARYLKRYGMTLEDYERMYVAQNGQCAICGVQVQGERMCVDHDHSTSKVRGLLCRLCNKSLGGFRDSLDLLERAIAYLKR